MNKRTIGPLLAVAMVAALAGCENSTGPGLEGTQAVSLSFGVSGGSAAPGASLFAGELELNDGVHTLVIQSTELVLKEIEFERVESTGCDSDIGDDDCEEYETGPFLVTLDMAGGVSQEITAQVDTGTYDEIEFKIHKTEDADVAFLADNPGFAEISIRVTGTYDGDDFVFTTDTDEEKELNLASPLIVTETSGPVNVTLTIDVSTWFVDLGGMLVDPRTANKGEPNESLVEENIKTSIDGFRDDDHDGVPHDDDGDEDDDSGTGS